MSEQQKTLNPVQSQRRRPISPHLSIYKLPASAILSIGHRISGVGLYFSISVISWWFFALVFSKFENCYLEMTDHIVAKIIICLTSYGFIYHLCTGVRHLFWDIGIGFDIRVVKISDIIVVASSVILTFIFWYFII